MRYKLTGNTDPFELFFWNYFELPFKKRYLGLLTDFACRKLYMTNSLTKATKHNYPFRIVTLSFKHFFFSEKSRVPMSRQKITIVLWNLRLVAPLGQKELHRIPQFVGMSRYDWMPFDSCKSFFLWSLSNCEMFNCLKFTVASIDLYDFIVQASLVCKQLPL